MENNLISQEVEELQQDSSMQQDRMESPGLAVSSNVELNTEFSTDSVINEIISRSFGSDGATTKGKKAPCRISLRLLARIIMTLNGALKKASSSADRLVEDNSIKDIEYWRNLAESRGKANQRCQQIIDFQQKRINSFNSDFSTLVNLARENQQWLAKIIAEKRAIRELGHGEHAD
ncbi:uncharacterized protein LOC108092431 [Drosophila ficusphila]|uniref:uncharacterized protein LOC108092431 n=1 Tax=Drosophila ficusphila TaxID=30025 RepID=UPI0007E8B27C|nr:uncharacterized protein LOC108092431 [Drosophila ficusphila]